MCTSSVSTFQFACTVSFVNTNRFFPFSVNNHYTYIERSYGALKYAGGKMHAI